MKEKRSFAPVAVAIVLLLLPILYVGTYFAVVSPRPLGVTVPAGTPATLTHYHVAPGYADWFFWPLEQIDRKVRPGAWDFGVTRR
jgi:hypothetical protein